MSEYQQRIGARIRRAKKDPELEWLGGNLYQYSVYEDNRLAGYAFGTSPEAAKERAKLFESALKESK